MAETNTSELEAINILLAAIGEAPLNTISGDLPIDGTQAKNTLTEGWKEVILVIVGGYISSFAKLVEFWYNSPADDQELVRSSQDFSTGLNGNGHHR